MYLRNTTWPACDLEVLGSFAVFQFLNEFHLASVHGRFRGRLATGTGVFALRRHCLALEPIAATCAKAQTTKRDMRVEYRKAQTYAEASRCSQSLKQMALAMPTGSSPVELLEFPALLSERSNRLVPYAPSVLLQVQDVAKGIGASRIPRRSDLPEP